MLKKENNIDLSIIIACYNEELYLKKNIKAIEKVLIDLKFKYEFIIIDDYSQNKTAEVIREICSNNENYKFYLHQKNIGRGGTVREGLLKSRGKYAGFLDIDLEVPVHYLPLMIKALANGYDAVIGYRFYDLLQGYGKLRAILSLIYRLLIRYYLKIDIKDSEAGYKFFNMRSCREIISKTKNNKWFWDTEIVYSLKKAQKKIKEIPCVYIKNKEKKSTVKLIPDVIDYIKALIKLKAANKKYN